MALSANVNRDLALLLGAGFSKWAAGLPVAAELFDFRLTPWGVREAAKLKLARQLKGEWDLLHPGGLAEQFVADSLQFGQKERRAITWYIVRRLSTPFIWEEHHAQRARRHVLMIDEHRCGSRPGVQSTRNFINQLGPLLSGIVTSNYDLLVEYALGTRNFNYGSKGQRLQGRGPYPVSTWKKPVQVLGDLPLAKVHGSISWGPSGFYTDGRRGLRGEALIVPPAPEKAVHRALAFTWTLAQSILASSRRLVVFGFGFNEYDLQLLELLRTGNQIRNVLLIDIAPKIGVAARLWPGAQIRTCRPPGDGHGYAQLREWLNSAAA